MQTFLENSSAATPAFPRNGAVVAGKYRITQVLARGERTGLFSALRIGTEERVAIEVEDRPAHGSDIVTAARAMSAIGGEHMVRVREASWLASGVPYVVMDELSGVSLVDHLRRQGPLSVATTVDYVVQVCDAIADAHLAGVSPLVLETGDLFLARDLEDGIERVKVIGRRSETSGDGTEVRALGLIACDLLTGGMAMGQESVPPDLPEPLEATLRLSLDPEGAKTFCNVGAFAMALAAFGSEGSAHAVAERTVRKLAGSPRPRGELPTIRPVSMTIAGMPPSVPPMLVPTPSFARGEQRARARLEIVEDEPPLRLRSTWRATAAMLLLLGGVATGVVFAARDGWFDTTLPPNSVVAWTATETRAAVVENARLGGMLSVAEPALTVPEPAPSAAEPPPAREPEPAPPAAREPDPAPPPAREPPPAPPPPAPNRKPVATRRAGPPVQYRRPAPPQEPATDPNGDVDPYVAAKPIDVLPELRSIQQGPPSSSALSELRRMPPSIDTHPAPPPSDTPAAPPPAPSSPPEDPFGSRN